MPAVYHHGLWSLPCNLSATHVPVHMSHRFFSMPPRAFRVFYIIRYLTETVIAMRLSLYGHQVFRTFTCKVLGVLKLACGDTPVSNDFVPVGAILLLPWLKYLICLFNLPILVTFLKVLSACRPCKCFSTCLEHLAVVLFFYSIIMFMYWKPMNTKSYISNMIFTVLCIVDSTPMKQAVICKDRDLDFLSVSSNANTNAGQIIELWEPPL